VFVGKKRGGGGIVVGTEGRVEKHGREDRENREERKKDARDKKERFLSTSRGVWVGRKGFCWLVVGLGVLDGFLCEKNELRWGKKRKVQKE